MPASSASAWGSLLPDGGADPIVKFTRYEAHKFYMDCMMKRNGSLPPLAQSDVARGSLVLEWFGAMASEQEKAVLLRRPPDTRSCRDLAEALGQLVKKRIAAGYRDARLTVPSRFMAGKFYVNSLEPHASVLADHVVVDSSQFRAWRHGKPLTVPPAGLGKRGASQGGEGGGSSSNHTITLDSDSDEGVDCGLAHSSDDDAR